MTVLDTIAAATPLERRITLCLKGDLQAEHDRLLADLVEASFKDKAEQSLASGNTAKVVAQLDRVRNKMLASEVHFTFAALPWFKRMELQAQHPPRDGSIVDHAPTAGYNVETYIPALIKAACKSVQGVDKKVVTEIPDEHWDHLLGKPATDDAPAVPPSLNFPQVDVLFGAAHYANESATTVPPSARSWLDSPDSGTSSKSPGPGTSHRNGSKGGSPRRPRNTSTTKKAASPA